MQNHTGSPAWTYTNTAPEQKHQGFNNTLEDTSTWASLETDPVREMWKKNTFSLNMPKTALETIKNNMLWAPWCSVFILTFVLLIFYICSQIFIEINPGKPCFWHSLLTLLPLIYENEPMCFNFIYWLHRWCLVLVQLCCEEFGSNQARGQHFFLRKSYLILL